MCHATNVIRNIEKITHSAPIHLTVTGPPRLYLDPETRSGVFFYHQCGRQRSILNKKLTFKKT